MSFPRYCQLRERFELHAPIEVARHCQIRLRSLPLAAVSNQIGFEPFPPSQLGVHLQSNEKAGAGRARSRLGPLPPLSLTMEDRVELAAQRA